MTGHTSIDDNNNIFGLDIMHRLSCGSLNAQYIQSAARLPVCFRSRAAVVGNHRSW